MMLYLSAILGAAILAWSFNAISLISWRRTAGAHWTERARILFPIRVSRQTNLWAIPLCVALAGYSAAPDGPWLQATVMAFLGALAGNWPFDRETNPDLTLHKWIHLVLVGWLLKFSMWLFYVAVAVSMPAEFNWKAWALGGIYLTMHLAMQFGLNLQILRWLRLLKPASARLQLLVDETSAKMGVKVRTTWEVVSAEANAMAFIPTGEMGFTDKLLSVCTDQEIKVICTHELGHLMESRWVKACRIGGGLMAFPLIFFKPSSHQIPEVGVVGPILLAAGIWWSAIKLGRTMETRADQFACDNAEDRSVYAQALERIYRANQIPAVTAKSSLQTHANLYDRMIAANLTPDYPRPAAPEPQCWSSKLTIIIVVILALLLVFRDFS